MENTLLNLIPAAYLPEIHLSQYDVGRTITFTLKDGASDYSVPSGASVKVKATKPSGFGFEVACTFNGGTVTLVTTDTMTPENGRFPAELSIVSGNTTIGTSNFIFNIERSPHPEGTIDGDAETIIPELTLLVERIEAAAEDVDEKAELFLNLSAEAETLEAGSPATASYSDGVLTLGIPRGYDGDDTKADAIVKSASGEVASFSDGGNGLLVKSLNVNITPKQSGSGVPSPDNVRPISGYDSVNVYVGRKNILPKMTAGTYSANGGTIVVDNDGVAHLSGTTTASGNVAIIPLEEPLTITSDMVEKGLYYHLRNSEINANISPSLENNSAVNLWTGAFSPLNRISGPAGSVGIGKTVTRIRFYVSSGVTFSGTYSPSFEFTNEVTDYEPYNGTSYPISLGQTVYGGTLEVMSGKLKKYPYYSSYNGETLSGRWICDRAVYSQGTTPPNGSQVVDMSGQGTEITLTPTQVKTLLGNNNIWSDSGSVEVEYRADTTLVYNELLSLIASLS